jgi:hypothetical protein
MPAWLMNNLGTIVVGLVVLAIIAAIVVVMIRNKKKGKSTCGCGCSNCPMGGACHSAKKNE